MRTSSQGLARFTALVAGLSAVAIVAMFAKWDWLSIALLGPAMFLFNAAGMEESIPIAVLVPVVYFSLLLAPTAVCLIRGRWARPLIVFQVVLLLPNMLMFLWVLSLSGITT